MNVINPNFVATIERPPAVSMDAIDQRLFEQEELLATIADFAHRDVLEEGNRIGNARIEEAGSRIYSMLRLARRDIAATRDVLDEQPDVPMRGGAAGQQKKASENRSTTIPDKTAWQDAVAEYYACRRLEEAHPFNEAQMSDVGYRQVCDDHSDLMKRLTRALKHAIAIPAPDCAGIAAKLDVIADYYDEHEWVVEHLSPVVADLRRLSEEAADLSMRGHHAAEVAVRQVTADLLPTDPVARFWRTFDEFNAGNGSDEEVEQVVDALNHWAPATARDFVRKFEAMFAEGGAPTEERVSILVDQAVALLGGERSGREC